MLFTDRLRNWWGGTMTSLIWARRTITTTTDSKTIIQWSYIKTIPWCTTPQYQLWTCHADLMSTSRAGREERIADSQTCLLTVVKRGESTMVNTKLKPIWSVEKKWCKLPHSLQLMEVEMRLAAAITTSLKIMESPSIEPQFKMSKLSMLNLTRCWMIALRLKQSDRNKGSSNKSWRQSRMTSIRWRLIKIR